MHILYILRMFITTLQRQCIAFSFTLRSSGKSQRAFLEGIMWTTYRSRVILQNMIHVFKSPSVWKKTSWQYNNWSILSKSFKVNLGLISWISLDCVLTFFPGAGRMVISIQWARNTWWIQDYVQYCLLGGSFWHLPQIEYYIAPNILNFKSLAEHSHTYWMANKN